MSNVGVVIIPEKFDFNFHSQFSKQTDVLIDDPQVHVISLNFSATHYLDSSALGMVVYLHKKASAANKKVVISNASGVAEEILRVANIQRLIDIV